MLGLAMLVALAAPARSEAPVNCTCMPGLQAPRGGEALPANALLLLQYCDPRRGDPPLEAVKVEVDGAPASLEVVPEWTTDLETALRIVPQPETGATVRLWFSPRGEDRAPIWEETYTALELDEVPPATGGAPRIRRGEPSGTGPCAPFERVIVDVEGADLGSESVTYAHVTMHGPSGEERRAVTRIIDAHPRLERWMHVPADVDRYEGRWCAELTMLDAAGNATALGTDCRTLDCACRGDRGGGGWGAAGVLGWMVVGAGRRRGGGGGRRRGVCSARR